MGSNRTQYAKAQKARRQRDRARDRALAAEETALAVQAENEALLRERADHRVERARLETDLEAQAELATRMLDSSVRERDTLQRSRDEARTMAAEIMRAVTGAEDPRSFRGGPPVHAPDRWLEIATETVTELRDERDRAQHLAEERANLLETARNRAARAERLLEIAERSGARAYEALRHLEANPPTLIIHGKVPEDLAFAPYDNDEANRLALSLVTACAALSTYGIETGPIQLTTHAEPPKSADVEQTVGDAPTSPERNVCGFCSEPIHRDPYGGWLDDQDPDTAAICLDNMGGPHTPANLAAPIDAPPMPAPGAARIDMGSDVRARWAATHMAKPASPHWRTELAVEFADIVGVPTHLHTDSEKATIADYVERCETAQRNVGAVDQWPVTIAQLVQAEALMDDVLPDGADDPGFTPAEIPAWQAPPLPRDPDADAERLAAQLAANARADEERTMAEPTTETGPPRTVALLPDPAPLPPLPASAYAPGAEPIVVDVPGSITDPRSMAEPAALDSEAHIAPMLHSARLSLDPTDADAVVAAVAEVTGADPADVRRELLAAQLDAGVLAITFHRTGMVELTNDEAPYRLAQALAECLGVSEPDSDAQEILAWLAAHPSSTPGWGEEGANPLADVLQAATWPTGNHQGSAMVRRPATNHTPPS